MGTRSWAMGHDDGGGPTFNDDGGGHLYGVAAAVSFTLLGRMQLLPAALD
ncbi:hypothetical protein [Crystallibacter crystallopoietes]|nr:hypothetical protein [Arthrobacter crystallopoietes]